MTTFAWVAFAVFVFSAAIELAHLALLYRADEIGKQLSVGRDLSTIAFVFWSSLAVYAWTTLHA